MPIKTILAYLPSGKTAPVVIDTALRLAGAHHAHIVALHVMPDNPVYAEYEAELPKELMDGITHKAQKAADGIKALLDGKILLDGKSKSNPVTYEWKCFSAAFHEGTQLIVSEARSADLVICAKQNNESAGFWGDSPDRLVTGSGRPVLLLPEALASSHIGGRVIIAWNGTREAARAAFDSLGLIQSGAEVRVVTFVDNEGYRGDAERAAANLVSSLTRHGIHASSEVSYAGGNEAGNAILSRVVDEGCDLLVMGCYGHSRFREIIFGGVSQDIIRDTFVPTLMSH